MALTTCCPCLPRSRRGPLGAARAVLQASSADTGPRGTLPAARSPAKVPANQARLIFLFVKCPALKIKNNKARETENANLTAASEEGRSTEPEARNSPSFLLYRVGLGFFLCQLELQGNSVN